MSIPVTDTYEYKQLTKVLEVLEQQREQVLKDKEIIQTAFQDALKSPIEYIESLIEGKIKLPKKINIVQIPNFAVGLPRYNNSSSGSSSHNNHHQASSSSSSKKRGERISDTPIYRTLSIDSSSSSRSKKILDPIAESDTENKKSALSTSTSNTDTIEGAPFATTSQPLLTLEKKRNDPQPKSFWTEDEQEKLERLLVEYPEEEVATHRWTKIANELGNRTPSQIASRTQKFFKKLEKAGKKIPGSTPKKKSSLSSSTLKTSSLSGLAAQSSSSDRSDTESTPIKRRETTTTTTPSSSLKRSFSTMKSSSSSSSSSSNIPTTISHTTAKPPTRTTNASSTSSSKMIHEGFKCDGCDAEPIVGTRWHCEECIQDVDLCQTCKESYEEIGSHNSSHHIIPIENPDPYFLDEDYKFSYPSG